jgi:hypothetical protein
VESRLACYQKLSDPVKGLRPEADIAVLDKFRREISGLLVLTQLRVAGRIGIVIKKEDAADPVVQSLERQHYTEHK